MRNTLRRVALATLLLVLGMAPTAQASVAEENLESAFAAMLAEPGNTGLTLRYARAAIEAADFEAAIGALEGLLMMSPDLTRVRVDLGVLYYRLESHAAAAYHLNKALADGGLDAAQNQRAQEFLTRVDDASDRHFVTGRISAGLRYRTNANAGPDSSTVRARGLDVELDDEFQEDGDGDFFVTANVRHVYDFRQQNALALETTGFFYGSRQFDLDRLNNFTLEATTGPRVKPYPTTWKGLDLRPHLVANVIFRDDDLLSNVYGVGLDLRYVTDQRLRISSRYQNRQRDFHASRERPFIERERDGHEHFFSLDGRYLLRDNVSLLARFNLIDRSAKARFNDSLELGIRVRTDITYDSPVAWSEGRWRFYVAGGYRDTDFDSANPRVDPVRVRDDREWRFNVGQAVPITGRLHAILEVSGQFVDSNLPNFERDNISTTLSMSYWF